MQVIFSLTLLSYLFLATGLVINYGRYLPSAFWVTSGGFLSLLIAILCLNRKIISGEPPTFRVDIGFIYAFFFSFLLVIIGPPVLYLVPLAVHRQIFPFLATGALFTVGMILFRKKRLGLICFFILTLFTWLASSLWVIKASPNPKIDTWYLQQNASDLLLRGENPYGKIFYEPIYTTRFKVADRYVYPPYSLLVSTPFYFFFGDIRYANIFMQCVAGLILFGICRRSGKNEYEAALLSTLFLFHPRWHFVLEQSWTESHFIVLLFGSIYFFLAAQSKTASILAGLLLGAKQYLMPLAVVFPHLLPKKAVPWLLFVFTFALLPLLFLIPSPQTYFQNVLKFHYASAFRADSLSLSAYMMRTFSWTFPSWLPFFLLFITLLAGLRHKETYKIVLYAALAYYLFFWLNKQAFANYYFFVEALLILGLALIPHRLKEKK